MEKLLVPEHEDDFIVDENTQVALDRIAYELFGS